MGQLESEDLLMSWWELALSHFLGWAPFLDLMKMSRKTKRQELEQDWIWHQE